MVSVSFTIKVDLVEVGNANLLAATLKKKTITACSLKGKKNILHKRIHL